METEYLKKILDSIDTSGMIEAIYQIGLAIREKRETTNENAKKLVTTIENTEKTNLSSLGEEKGNKYKVFLHEYLENRLNRELNLEYVVLDNEFFHLIQKQ